MALPITTILTSCLAIWLLILSGNVIRQRGAAKVSLNDGGDEPLLRKIRAQANLTEYAPIMILLTGLAEFQGADTNIIMLAAAVFFGARVAHGYALSFSSHSPKGRSLGIIFTLIPIGVVAIHNLTMFAI